MDLVESFLSDHSFDDAHRAFTKQRARNGWKSPAQTPGHGPHSRSHSLVAMFQTWETSMKDSIGSGLVTFSAMNKVKAAGSSSESEDTSSSEEDVAMVDVKKEEDGTSSSSESSSSGESENVSESESDSEYEQEIIPITSSAAIRETAAKRKYESSSDESSSESDSESGSEKEERPAKKTRVHPAEAHEPSDSSSESSSEDDVQGGSSGAAHTTQHKIKVEDSSSSESESESASESDSESDDEVQAAAQVPLPSGKGSSSESDSESESEPSSSDDSDDEMKPPPTEQRSPLRRDSDTSVTVTVGKTSPEFFPVSTFAPLPPDPPKANNRGKGINKQEGRTQNAPFSRIARDSQLDPRLSSNAYIPHEYGNKAYEDLSVTKGKAFTKEKNKKKRGSYRGGRIDPDAKNGIRFDD
jgi:hypothetical protein